MAAPTTVAARLPMVTVTGLTRFATGSEGGNTPGATDGLAAPQPVPHKMITSPGLAGTDGARSGSPARRTGIYSRGWATASFPLRRKTAGDTVCNCSVSAALVEPL